MVSGSALATMPVNIFGTFGTIASTIVQQLDGSLGDGTGFELRTLAEFALVLAVITLVANVGARLLVRRVAGTALPVGREYEHGCHNAPRPGHRRPCPGPLRPARLAP